MELSTNEIALALSMIDAHRWRNAGSKIAAALVITVNTAGDPRARGMLVPLGRRHVSAATGMEDRWTRRVLGELVDDRVLAVVDEAAGSRGRCYRVNPELADWRVPWRGRISAELVAYRLAVLSGRLQPATNGITARYTAPQTQIVAGYGTRQFRRSGAPYRATTSNGAGSHTAPQSLAACARVPLTTDSLSTTRETEQEEEEQKKRSDLAERLARAIRTRTSRPLYGAPLTRLTAACEGLDEHQADAVERHVAGLESASFLTLIEGACQYADDLRAGATVRRPGREDELARTRAMLEEERAGPKAPLDFFDGLRAALRDDDLEPCETGGGEEAP